MLVDRDPTVLARINLFAVLGALCVLPEVSPDAQRLLRGVDRPTTVTFRVAGLPRRSLTFSPDGIRSGVGGERRIVLALTSPAHLNRLVDGTAQPLPLTSPAGLRFLTGVFSPLTEELGRILKPSDTPAHPWDEAATATLSLHVAIAAVAQVANWDRSGRASASLIPDGQIAIEVGDDLELRVHAEQHSLRVAPATADDAPARAALRFRSLDVAGDVLTGRSSALTCIGDGSMAMRGYIPMIDNVSRILDRVGHYLGD